MPWLYSCTESPKCRFNVYKTMYFYLIKQTVNGFQHPFKCKWNFNLITSDWAASIRVYYAPCNEIATYLLWHCPAQLAKLWKHVPTSHFLSYSDTDGRQSMLQHSRERHAIPKLGNCSSCHSEEFLTTYNEIDKHRWKPGNSFKWKQ